MATSLLTQICPHVPMWAVRIPVERDHILRTGWMNLGYAAHVLAAGDPPKVAREFKRVTGPRMPLLEFVDGLSAPLQNRAPPPSAPPASKSTARTL
ncbi:unnamed protein product [Amoebophrya sp. A120]|nr:unnamed protein product [Amoebophrya sp. A120]|eukprot:GSA120T00024275001.1